MVEHPEYISYPFIIFFKFKKDCYISLYAFSIVNFKTYHILQVLSFIPFKVKSCYYSMLITLFLNNLFVHALSQLNNIYNVQVNWVTTNVLIFLYIMWYILFEFASNVKFTICTSLQTPQRALRCLATVNVTAMLHLFHKNSTLSHPLHFLLCCQNKHTDCSSAEFNNYDG